MGTTAEKLSYLNTTKGKIKDSINLTGANITDEPFRQYATKLNDAYVNIINNGTDTLYDNFPKVTGEGTSLTLNNTYEAPIRSSLKGNTEQFTTTGKNLLDTTNISTISTQTGITITPTYEEGLLKNLVVSGTPTTTSWNTIKSISLKAGSYILTGLNISDTTKTGLRIGVYIDSARQYFVSANSTSYSFTLEEETGMNFVVWVQSVSNYPTGTNIITPMIRLASVSDDTYEPYTGGQASPNPDYPQDIHVVSGDNTIKVTGKNLLQNTLANETTGGVTITNNSDGSFTIQGTSTTGIGRNIYGEITLKPGTYTFSANNIPSGIYISLNNVGYTMLNATTFSKTFTLANDTTYARVLLWIEGNKTFNNTFKVQLEKGSSATDYEPYSSNSYNIDLPVENLFNISNSTLSKYIDGSGNLQNTSNSDTSDYIPVKANTTYTLSWNNTLPLNSTSRREIVLYNTSKTFVSTMTLVSLDSSTKHISVTPTTDGYIRFDYDKKCYDIMFEKGEKVNSFTPYGTTPIELCDFNTYKDNFLRTSGKNLFDKDNANIVNAFINPTGYVLQANDNMRTLYIPCKPNTTYTVSKIQSARFVLGTSNTTAIGSSMTNGRNNFTATQLTITSGANDTYLLVFFYNGNADTLTPQQILDTIQIEKGTTTATDYEPYGSGEWYKYNAINYVMFDGSEDEDWIERSGTSANYWKVRYNGGLPTAITGRLDMITNYFVPNNGANVADYSGNAICGNLNEYAKWVHVSIDNTIANSVASFRTWLSTHNLKVYYTQATPNYTKITYEPLLEQLEAFYNAKSKNSQTNITQENNDLPFIIDSTMLKEV